MDATIIPPDGGEEMDFGGNKLTLKVLSEHTAGQWSSMEMVLGPPPSFGPPLHTHPHAETFIVLSGRVELQAGERRVVAEAGAIVVAPGGTPHTFVNRADGESRVLVIFSPGGFEAYFREAKELLKGGQAPTPELMLKLSAKYNQEIVGPPLS